MELDSTALLKQAQRGDWDAAGQLVNSFYKRIFAFLRRLSGNDEEAADLTQRTFARVWQSLPTFAGRSSVASWIHSIAYHVYVDWRRADRRPEPRTAVWWELQPDLQPNPAEAASRNDASAAVFSAIDKLEPDLRDTIHLHYYQELTLQETAGALGIAASTVKYRVRQALDELQKSLAGPINLPNRSVLSLTPAAADKSLSSSERRL